MTALPAGWSRTTLGEIAETVRNGIFASRPTDHSDGVKILRISAVRNGRVGVDDCKYVAGLVDEQITKFSLSPGDLLFTRYNGSRRLVGICGLVPEHAGPILHPDKLIRVVVPNERVDSRFLNYQMESHGVRAYLEPRIRTTAGQSGIAGADIRGIPLLMPPLAEQWRIVDILEDHLSRLDAAEASFASARAKMLALRDAILTSALFADMAGIAGDRSRVTVGVVAAVDSGPAFKSGLFGGSGEGTRLLRGDNIEPGRLRWARTKSWPDSQLDGFEHLLVAEGDIILAMDRPVVSAGLKLARVTASDTPALLVQRVARIRPHNTVIDDFLHQILSSRQFIHQLLGDQVGTQIPHITLEAIRNFSFLLPELEVQIAVAKQVRASIESTERVERDIALASARSHSLRRALFGAAFSGRLTGRTSDMEMVEEMAGV